MTSEEIKALLDEQMKLFENFKAENDKLQAKRGENDALQAEKVEKIGARLDEIAEQLKNSEQAAAARADAIEKKMNRSGLGGVGAGDDANVGALFAKQRGIRAFGAEDVKNYRAALDTYWRRGKATPHDLLNTLQTGSDPEGGYWVLPDTSGRIIQKIYESSPIRQYASIQTIGTDALEGAIDNDEADAGWEQDYSDDEETDAPETGQWRIPVWAAYAQPKAKQDFLDDAMVDVEGWLNRKIAEKLARVENTACVATGTGVGRPRAFLQYPTSDDADKDRDWGTLQYIASGGAGAFASSNPGDALLDLIYSLKAGYRQGANFFMNRATVGAVRKLKDGQSNYLWQPSAQAGQPATLMGYGIAEFEDMPDIAANAYAIAFGNMAAAYQIVDRAGISILRDPYTKKGFVKFYTRKRTGGGLLNSEALKLMKFATS